MNSKNIRVSSMCVSVQVKGLPFNRAIREPRDNYMAQFLSLSLGLTCSVIIKFLFQEEVSVDYSIIRTDRTTFEMSLFST